MPARRTLPLLLTLVLALTAGLAVAAGAGGSPPAADADPAGGTPAAAATGYLQARAAAVTSDDPAAVLAPWLAAGSRLAASEALIAKGAALRERRLGHLVDDVTCDVTVTAVSAAADGTTATVVARAVTTTVWHASGGATTEASAVDHVVTLVRAGGRWLVAADSYSDDTVPACLEAAGAPPARVLGAARALERRARAGGAVVVVTAAGGHPGAPAAGSKWLTMRRYRDTLSYDRAAAAAYADRYALDYNPAYVRFSADCANFASQCANAGGMPKTPGTGSDAWWYDRQGTAGTTDDTWSLSWVNVTAQMTAWNGRTTDRATSAGSLSRGDFIYYDWSGDGRWDHVAVVVGTNSAGQKIIDAHTTDHYHVYWKLGTSATRYRFAHTRAQWVV